MPLNCGRPVRFLTWHGHREFYEKDKHLGKYLHIIKDSPVYPVMLDANRTVLSMPPIINGDHSKITLKTRNVFIDLTATDETKLEVVANMMVTLFVSNFRSALFEAIVDSGTVHVLRRTVHDRTGQGDF